MQLGLNSAIGIAPRTQIGSQLILNAIGIYNGNAKINLLRLDRLDLALTGAYLTLPGDPNIDGDLSIDYYGAGIYSSLQLLENRAWSIHAGAQANRLSIDGFPTFSGLNSILTTVTGLEEAKLQEIQAQITDVAEYENQSDILTITLATDYRLNRRDSFILQGSGFFAQNNGLGLQVKYEDTTFCCQNVLRFFRFRCFQTRRSSSSAPRSAIRPIQALLPPRWHWLVDHPLSVDDQLPRIRLEIWWSNQEKREQNAGYVRAQQRSSKGRS